MDKDKEISDYAKGLNKGSLLAYTYILKTLQEDGAGFAERLLLRFIENELAIEKSYEK